MPASFADFLDAREMTPLYRQLPVLGETYFTDNFFRSPQTVNSDSVELISINKISNPSPGNTRGNAARILKQSGATKKLMSLFHVFNETPLEMDALRALREMDSLAMQEKGEQIVTLAAEEQATRDRMFKEIVIANIMHTGVVNLNSVGEILTPSVNSTTGAVTDAAGTHISADFGVANGHRGNLGGTISALWSVAGTKIGTQLDAIKLAARKAGVPVPTEIYVHETKKSVLRANTEFNDWAKYNSMRIDDVLRNEGIDGLWGFNWHFVGGGYYDASDTWVDLLPTTQALICPAVGPWLRAFEGSELLPNSIDIQPNAQSALSSLVKVYGPFAYAKLLDNPVRLSMFSGDNFGLGFADPNSVWCPTVFA